MTLSAGQTFGPYRVVEPIGRGGMATVYKAHQASLARFVALKVLPAYLADDEGFRERFRAEAVTIAKMRHPNILQVYDYGEENGLHYLVTEFVDGGTLADQLGSPLPADYVVRLLGPIASALDYAHARDLVHRDVKPSNVLLARDGTPVLSDFGLARMLMGSVPRLTQTGAVIGTPEYMAPEQAMGEDATPASDRYALAVIAYEMLAGSVPFSADTPLATLLAHAHKPLPPPRQKNPQLSAALEAALLKGLAKEPADRYATVHDLMAALETAAAVVAPAVASPVAAAPAPARTAPTAGVARPPAPRGLLVGAIAAAVLVVALVAAFATGVVGRPAASAPRAVSAVKGALLWQASLDASGSDLRQPTTRPSASAAALRSAAGSLECVVLQQGASASAGIGRPMSPPYFAEVDVSAQAQPNFAFIWALRTSSSGSYQVRVEGVAGGGRLQLAWVALTPGGAGGAGPQAAASGEPLLPKPVALDGWGTGKQSTLAAAVSADTYTLFVDGQQVADVKGDRVAASASSLLGIACSGAPGTAKVTALRVYELRSP